MKRIVTATLVASTLLLLPTACGVPSGQSTGSTSTNQTSNNTSNTNTSNTTNSTSSGANTQTAGIQLQPFTSSNTGIQAQVPAGWTQTTLTGGDYTGWKFVNPQDATQVITIIRSSCVGCAMLNGSPDPKQPIPEKDATNVTVSADGLTANYNFAQTDNPNPGVGILTVSKNTSGYAYVQVQLPQADAATATQIVNSFSLNA